MNHPIFFSVAVLNLIKGVYYKYIQLVEVVSNTVFRPIFFRLGRKKIQFELMNLFHHGIEATNKGKFMGSFFADHLGSRPTDCSVTSKLYGDFIFSCLEVVTEKQVTGQLFLHNSNLLYLNMFISASFNVATYVGNSCATSSNLIHSINTEVSQSCK